MQMLVSPGDGSSFTVHIEPEGMEYELPPHDKVLLTFIGPRSQTWYLDVRHEPNALVIWRPGDTEVWATLADGTRTQIARFDGVPAPWLDSASELSPRDAPWDWPPPPTS
jgi:hypothetical protein